MKKITILTPCYNEEENVAQLVAAVREQFTQLPQYEYEHLFIDNASTDRTVDILRVLAHQDTHVKVILNARNFGHIRSQHHGFLQARGDAVIILAADFQDPPELIPDFLKKWEEAYKIVVGVKHKSRENKFKFLVRRIYYQMMSNLSKNEHIEDFTGFGLYDRKFVDIIKLVDDPYPYFRGLVAELGMDRYEYEYVQPKRLRGKTKYNFLSMFDMALTGMVNHTKFPLRLATLSGFIIAFASFIVAIVYFVFKMIYWDRFQVGLAALVVGFFFFAAVQLFFIGIIGEYIGAIFTQVRKRPYVIEKERIGFDEEI